MNHPKRVKGSEAMNEFSIVIIVILAVFLTGSILQATYFKGKRREIKPYGQLVEIKDGQMHIHAVGSGVKTIVLLPGMGIPFPAADFGPLMRRLGEEYTVVCVEYFGVGLSSVTKTARTAENYVEEIREALDQAGFKPPYVLMPHSISSVFSEYYASRYPEEIEAVISLDGTTSAHYEAMPDFVGKILKAAKFQQALGFSSVLSHLTVKRKDLRKKGYTDEEISDQVVMAGFNINSTLLEQIVNSAEFIKHTMELPYPESVPFFKIISKDTYEKPNKQLKTMTPQEYQHNHLDRIGKHAEYKVLEGSHFIYHDNADEILSITESVLKKS